jgi:competence protein ComEC
MRNFRIARFDYSDASADPVLKGLLDIARKKQIEMHPLHAGIEEKVGPVRVRVLNPPADSRLASANENSLVFRFSFRRLSALLTGDLGKSGEAEVLLQPGNLRSHLLKVAHHGSRSGTSNAFLDRVQPHWSVISVGRNNPFGHPSPEVLLRLLRHGARPLLTLDEGALTFETDGLRYAIKSHISGILEHGDLEELVGD